MSPRIQLWESIRTQTPLTVGAIADPESLTSPTPACDVVELRLDSLNVDDELIDFAKSCPLPLLITARGLAEGGQRNWTIEERASAYLKIIPYASSIDIELRDFNPLSEIISAAKKQKIVIIGSFHDFDKTPPPPELAQKQSSQADLHKFALMATSLNCIQTQLSLFSTFNNTPLSIMGMGPLGAAARPLMAKAGSLLNYGYLGSTPTAPNQWPAGLLKQAISV